ncbi:MAG TPA: S8 family serine peptidase [Tahibacter sp.]|uniref:S8 family serine peptidase n=1 Tax=Tahibacter sp. TaxID=2056211 RepID=UPI002B5F87C5|nr:S8 family serine peptidase [Tahibacter sp.]HSX62289.1 S8 family serine peptidase [Tahibacter sp.]
MRNASIITLTSAIGFALMGVGIQSSAPAHAAGFGTKAFATTEFGTPKPIPYAGAGPATGIRSYIITFAEAGVLNYTGGVSGIASTAPQNTAGQRKLDIHTPAAQTYLNYLAEQRAAHVDAIGNALHRPLAATHSYAVTLNGVAAMLDEREVAAVASVPGVKSVRLAGEQRLDTYRGPAFIGADRIWNGTATPSQLGTKGKGVVVGILDAGTNSGHPSFKNDPACSFRPSAPKLLAADCSTTDANGFCNGPNPEATPGVGHGVHTSSTVAGNTLDNTANPAPPLPNGTTMSGVAPCAAIRHYEVCQGTSCSDAHVLAGINNAIADQVDVLNFSISGGTDPWNDNDRSFLDAVNADVLVVAAAGNTQPADTTPVGKVNHLGPWVLTVAASTQDQRGGPQLTATGPGTVPPGLVGIPLTPGSTTNPGATTDLTGQVLRSYPTNLIGCTADGGFPANYFQGSIAVVRRGTCPFTEKITNAFNAGAQMVLVANNQPAAIVMDTTGAPAVPAFSIDQSAGDALIAFIAPTNPPADRIFADAFEPAAGARGNYKRFVLGARQGDVLAGFSYRGPAAAPTVDSTKPDISAPGVDIFAALDIQSGNYGLMSGTSMAAPHVTGAAALVRSAHPDWSVQEVKSALMMTATNATGVKEDGVTPWNADDVGSGRVDLTKAALAGLTMDETYANLLAADPAAAGDVKTLNVPALRNMDCATTGCSWTRTVKNRLGTAGTWTVTSSTASTFALTATPGTFTLAPGATQTITFTATPNAQLTESAFGTATLTASAGLSPPQHITVVINQSPPSVICHDDACSFQIDSYATGDFANPTGCGEPACEFLWLNRFSPKPADYPFTLNTVQTVFNALGATEGQTFDVFIYQDNDNDPANGATLRRSLLGQSIANPLDALQTITIPGGLTLTGSGDVLIALVTRTPSTFPATADACAFDQQRSWIGGIGSVPASPDLSTLNMQHIGNVVPGFCNWIIRAQGTNTSGPVQLGVGSSRPDTGK